MVAGSNPVKRASKKADSFLSVFLLLSNAKDEGEFIMADHYNQYPLKQLAGTVASCMDLPLPSSYAPPIAWVSDLLKARMGGPADRVVL